MYGLTKNQCNIFFKILFAYKNEILQVKLFGSRSRNDYKKTSDIDIAVKFSSQIKNLLANSFYPTSARKWRDELRLTIQILTVKLQLIGE